MPTINNSTFLDYTSYGTTTASTVTAAYGIATPIAAPSTDKLNVAFILERANDPTALLSGNWAERQTALKQLNDSGTLWSTYGATSIDYEGARAVLSGYGTIVGDQAGAGGYVTSQESRTIWVTLDPAQFASLFGTQLYKDGNMYYWEGNLSLPTGLDIAGLWFDTYPWFGPSPASSNLSSGAAVMPNEGPLSIGNNLAAARVNEARYPGTLAEHFYDFPLAGEHVPTATVGLIEPGIGDAMPSDYAASSFQVMLDAYRAAVGIPTPGKYYAVQQPNPTAEGNAGERTLDVGVVASAAPGSMIGIYGGSSFTAPSNGNVFTSYQAAFWDHVHNPPVISSSYSIMPQTNPNSPFAYAVQQLFIDSALRNITMVQANNDFGSSWSMGTGLANQAINSSSPFMLLVGGTSLTSLYSAPYDSTFTTQPLDGHSVYGLALSGDLQTLWRLIEGGLSRMPSLTAPAEALESTFLEAVWNSYVVSNGALTTQLGASDGGVDTTQPTPSYQTAFGLTPTSINPSRGTGRGAPDVSADAGGNMYYLAPDPLILGGVGFGAGTSAATPLWASLIAQIDTIFNDQGLPNLGYAHDLIYTAAAVAPASFNDINYGNNITSFYYGGTSTILNFNGDAVTWTGYGYYAGPGYDLTTGLGSPNGTLLARALSSIAHSQMYFSSSPAMLDQDDSGGWISGVQQDLMFQSISSRSATIGVEVDAGEFAFGSAASASFAWTNRLAQQSLQADFDANLVRLFDKQSQGFVSHANVQAGQELALSINGSATQLYQGTLSTAFGFGDFMSDEGVVRVARSVAVAETAGGANDTTAIVRLRQNGEDFLSVSFYKVDDYTGAIGGLHAGDAGYASAAAQRAYQLTTGGTWLAGPGYGNYGQAGLLNVDAGDLIAMSLVDATQGTIFWAFARGNELVNGQHAGHLWSYGLNTWGWEDTRGLGDRDYNDLIVQLDFTSASGHGWLV